MHSEDIVIDGIKIKNSLFAPNADGIDITGSRFVRVSNCDITTCDDAIVLKTWMHGKSCEDIVVTNCTLETLCAALKLGTESYADFRRIAFSNCAVRAASRLFAIYIRDGATAEDVIVSNIVGTTKAPLVLNRPIQLMVTKRNKNSSLGVIKNVFVDNMICKTDGRLLMTADEGGTIENVRLENLHLEYPFIEDPEPVGQVIKSQQFPQQHPEMIKARGAIVAKNMKVIRINNLTIAWPGENVPEDWQIPVRIINGDFDLNFKHDYSKAKQAEFSVIVGEKLTGGYIDLSQVKASDEKTDLIKLMDSNIEIIK
ncbi:MAG: glycosyl hydrolase family 28 protein [Bacteroidota bacterium]